jgi:hypothetical protein
VAVINGLCSIFAYVFGTPGDMIVTFYAVIFRESMSEQRHLNDFHTEIRKRSIGAFLFRPSRYGINNHSPSLIILHNRRPNLPITLGIPRPTIQWKSVASIYK